MVGFLNLELFKASQKHPVFCLDMRTTFQNCLWTEKHQAHDVGQVEMYDLSFDHGTKHRASRNKVSHDQSNLGK